MTTPFLIGFIVGIAWCFLCGIVARWYYQSKGNRLLRQEEETGTEAPFA